MAQMMRKKGEDHLYLYDPKDFDGSVFEIVELEEASKPAPAKARKVKTPPAEPVLDESDLADDDFNFVTD